MVGIFQEQLPFNSKRENSLPGISPLDPLEWLIQDEAYAAQMEERERLIARKRATVIALDDLAVEAAVEL